jgi:hypothetical protein
LQNGKISVENRSICLKNTTLNPKDGDLLSKSMPSLPESRSSKRPWNDTQTS